MKTITLLTDYREENWPSMDYCGEMLAEGLKAVHAGTLAVRSYCPPFAAVHGRLTGHAGPTATTPDRFLNRYLAWPLAAAAQRGSDYLHLVDHSYALAALALPAARTGVFLHDLDAVACLLTPEAAAQKSRAYRFIAQGILSGIQRAALVFFTTSEVRRQVLAHKLVRPERLVRAPLGYAREFTLAGTPARMADGRPYLMHVGGNLPRKRFDVLLKTFAETRRQIPDLQLLKVGGEWSAEQRQFIEAQGLTASITHLHNLGREALASWYRGAAAVLVTSEAEGFGLPIIEALACGAPVIASDIAVFREVAGEALVFAPVAAIEHWVQQVLAVLRNTAAPAQPQRLAVAARYGWDSHARIIGDAYLAL